MMVPRTSVASLGGRGRTAPGDTLQGVTPERKKIVGKFTKNSGETSVKKVRGDNLEGVTPE